MDQKQRIMTVGGGVLGLLALILIVRALLGGGAAPEPATEAMQAYEEAVQTGVLKVDEAPPEVDTGEPGSGKFPSGGG